MFARACVRARTRVVLPIRHFSLSAPRTSGHNKWSKIKTGKGILDKARGVAFSKHIREIESAIRMGGGNLNVETNSQLANALKRAKSGGLPKENIENALKRAAGNASRSGTTVMYQAMIKGKVPLMIECLTDNPKRTAGKVKEVLGKHGARTADVGFMFTRQGRVAVSGPSNLEDDLMALAIESGADDIAPVPKEEDAEAETDTTDWEVTLPPENVEDFTRAVGTLAGLNVNESEVAQMCSVQAEDVEDALDSLRELVEALEEDPDVVRVWTVD